MHRFKKRFLTAVFITLSIFLTGQGLHAKETERLSSFSSAAGPIKLDRTENDTDLFIPMASTVNLRDVVVSLKVNRSAMLLAGRSSLSVRFNETTIAQIPYVANQTTMKPKVKIPSELWRSGFNKLTLSVVQHYTTKCENTEATDLWTEIDLYNSTISYNIAEKWNRLRLRDLSGLFSPGIGGVKKVQILLPGEADLKNSDSLYLQALPLVAQGLGKRRDFAPLAFSLDRVTREQIAGRLKSFADLRKDGVLNSAYYLPNFNYKTHVLIGTKAELEKILPKSVTDKIEGAFLYIDRTTSLKREKKVLIGSRKRLIVSGTTEEEVLLAARTLAEMDDQINPTSFINILKRDVAPEASLASSRFLQEGETYKFSSIGRPTRIASGKGTKTFAVNIPIGADFYSHEASMAELFLNFGYGPGLGEGSTMSIFLNNEYIHGLALGEKNGAAFENYKISIPARKLTPGMNLLELKFTLKTQTLSGECRAVSGKNLFAQLLGSSSIKLPKAKTLSTQPNLRLFAATAFPYMVSSRVNDTNIYIGSEDMMDGALALASKLAQIVKSPSDNIKIRVGVKDEMEGDAILLATPSLLNKDLFKEWNGAITDTLRLPYRALNDMKNIYKEGTLTYGYSKRENTLSGSIYQTGKLSDMGVILALENPKSETSGTLTMILADTSELVNEKIDTLVSPAIWNQMSGDLFIWRDKKKPVFSMQVSDSYVIGEKNWFDKVSLLFTNNPFYGAIFLIIATVILTLVLSRYISVRKEKKMAE